MRFETLRFPWSEAAERAVLGAMISDPEEFVDAAALHLNVEDFYGGGHQLIFAALQEMRNEGVMIDTMTLVQWLEDRQRLEEAGGVSIPGELAAGFLNAVTFGDHVQTVRKKSLLRDLMKRCVQILAGVEEEGHDALALIDSATESVQRVADRAMGGQRDLTVKTARQCAIEFVENAERVFGKRNTYNGIPSGFYQLDLLLKGFQAGEVVTIAAKSGLGKTAFMLNLMHNMATRRKDPETGRDLRPGYRVGCFSIEMNHLQLTNRMMSMMSKMPSGHVRTPQSWTQVDMDTLSITAEAYAALNVTIDADGFMTPEKFRARARWMVKSKGVEIIFLDYLQLMQLSGKVHGDYDTELTRQASEAVRQTAKELGIPIVSLVQFNKEGMKSGRPTMGDIKGSGKIIQDSHYILIMHEVEGDGRGEGDVMQIQVTVDKAREAERGVFRRFDYTGYIYTFKEQQSGKSRGGDPMADVR